MVNRFINLCPHNITLLGDKPMVIPKGDTFIKQSDLHKEAGVKLRPALGVIYIVSNFVKNDPMLFARPDVLSPREQVFVDGKCIGCKSLR